MIGLGEAWAGDDDLVGSTVPAGRIETKYGLTSAKRYEETPFELDELSHQFHLELLAILYPVA